MMWGSTTASWRGPKLKKLNLFGCRLQWNTDHDIKHTMVQIKSHQHASNATVKTGEEERSRRRRLVFAEPFLAPPSRGTSYHQLYRLKALAARTQAGDWLERWWKMCLDLAFGANDIVWWKLLPDRTRSCISPQALQQSFHLLSLRIHIYQIACYASRWSIICISF